MSNNENRKVPPVRKVSGVYLVEDREGRPLLAARTIEEAMEYHKKIYGMETLYSVKKNRHIKRRVYQ